MKTETNSTARTVYSAKTNETLTGVASEELVAECASNAEGKCRAAKGSDGIWYPANSPHARGCESVIVYVDV